MLKALDPVVLLQHGGLDSLTGKTGWAMLRHRQGPIVAVIDPTHAGKRLEDVTGIARSVPVVADLAAALPYGPSVAVVGCCPPVGCFQAMRADVLAALQAGLSIASGLHTRLDDDLRCMPRCSWSVDLGSSPGTRGCSGGASARCRLVPPARAGRRYGYGCWQDERLSGCA